MLARAPSVGTRLDLFNLVCCKVTHYERPAWDHESVETVWRYAFKDEWGLRYVYSGQFLNVAEGATVSIRATVKQQHDRFGFCRLSRPKIISRDLRPHFI